MKLEVQDLSKSYGAVQANNGVALTVEAGEIHALLGENGAGKSTLIKVLAGLVQPDSGKLLLDGVAQRFANPRAATAAGLGVVHQHFMLVDTLNAFENASLACPRLTPAQLSALADEHGLRVPLEVPVGQLSVGQRQRVEILKALSQGARLLVLDEPTAVLTPAEVEGFFAVLRSMAAAGRSIIFVSHKLPEVLALCQKVTVLRQGRTVFTSTLEGMQREELAAQMVGRAIVLDRERPSAPLGEVRLEISALGLTVRAGEILGIAGVSGNGQEALARSITGMDRTRASVRLDGLEFSGLSVAERVERGLAFIPEDRQRTGAVLSMSVAENGILRDARRVAPRGWLPPGTVCTQAQALIDALDVRCEGPSAVAGSLSGGNLQKLIVARELARQPAALVAAQPSRGVDIGATHAIHDRLLAERARGLATLLISEDLDELMFLSDRIAVMVEGRVVKVLERGASREEIGLAMAAG